MQLMLEYIRENKIKLIVFLVILIVVLAFSLIMKKGSDKKIYATDSYVYTRETYDYGEGLESKLPYINVKSNDVAKINSEIIEKYYEITTIGKEMMDYDYYRNGNVISLIVKTYNIESVDSYPTSIVFYNIDIDEQTVLNNLQILRKYGASNNDVEEAISSKLKEYYEYETKKGYISGKECDFDCYMTEIGGYPILDGCNYYVKDDALMAYKSVSLDVNFFYDVNSGFNLFNFKVKDIK